MSYNRHCYCRKSWHSESSETGALKKTKSGDISAYRYDNILVMGWKDKRAALMIYRYGTSIEQVVNIQKGGS
jgi:hypothetical protein